MLEDDFWAYVSVQGDCWIWAGPKNSGNGGPALWRDHSYVNPIFIARELSGLEKPERGSQRTITCGNLLCVRPKHNLYLSTEQRFWLKVDVRGEDECWLWRGVPAGNNGYGNFYITSANRIFAHRNAFELVNGPVPRGMEVIHSCDTPLCVNPKHLRAGTHQENMSDGSRKGRLGGFVRRSIYQHDMRGSE